MRSTKKGFALLTFAVLGLAAANHAAAVDKNGASVFHGLGSARCSDLRAKVKGDDTHWGYWVGGYVSGYNGWKYGEQDYIDGSSISTIAQSAYDWCASNPDRLAGESVIAVVGDYQSPLTQRRN